MCRCFPLVRLLPKRLFFLCALTAVLCRIVTAEILEDDSLLPPPVGEEEAEEIEELDVWPPEDLGVGTPNVLLTATEPACVCARASYLSPLFDLVAVAGGSQASGKRQYAFLGVRTPWLTVGRLYEPFLYRLAARSMTSAVDLDRRSLGSPFTVATSFPSFSTAHNVINRVVVHPFGNPVALWAGASGGGEQEMGTLVRLEPSARLAVEGLALLYRPQSGAVYRKDDSWFPERLFDPCSPAASIGMRIWSRGEQTTNVCAVILSGGLLWPPGAMAVVQSKVETGGITARARSCWATPQFRTLRKGLPAEIGVTDAQLEVGYAWLVGAKVSGSYTLYRAPPLPGVYLPDRSVAAAAIHCGPGWLRATVQGRIRRDRDKMGYTEENRRGRIALQLGTGKTLAQCVAACNVYIERGRYRRTVLSAALRTGRLLALWLKPSLELRSQEPDRLKLSGSLSANLPGLVCRLTLETRDPILIPGSAQQKSDRLPVVATLSFCISAK